MLRIDTCRNESTLTSEYGALRISLINKFRTVYSQNSFFWVYVHERVIAGLRVDVAGS